jgi:hypothetical protein
MHNALNGGLVNFGMWRTGRVMEEGERATWRNALIERFVQIHDHHDAGLYRHAKPRDGSDPHRNAKVAAKSLAPPTRVRFPAKLTTVKEMFSRLALNAPFLEPGRNMNQQIVNQTPYRRKHSARRWVNEVKNILRPRPFRQHSFDKPLF